MAKRREWTAEDVKRLRALAKGKHAATDSPIAGDAIQRIGELYGIEAEIRGHEALLRQQARQARAGPKLTELRRWLIDTVKQLSKKSDLAGAIHYALSRWKALTRYCEDGRIEIDNNAAEPALRMVAWGVKIISSPARIAAASAPPPFTPSSAPPSSMASIRKRTCAMF
jgi:hypothetical protein